jgi:hypothetical protein
MHCLLYVHVNRSCWRLYLDSKSAVAWVRAQICALLHSHSLLHVLYMFEYKNNFEWRQRKERLQCCCKIYYISISITIKINLFFIILNILKDTSIVFPVIPLGVFLFMASVIANKSTNGIYLSNVCLYILSFGLVWAKMTIQLIVSDFFHT